MTPRRPREQFIGWVHAHHAAVFASAWRIVRNRADADDVVAQVFVHALEAPEEIAKSAEPERRLRWLAVKTALTLKRGEANRRRREEAHAMGHPESERAGAGDEPHGDAVRRERLAAVRAGVAALPEELRLATVLRFQEGLTFAAMAELADVSEPTMFERVKRALEKLRGALTQAGHGAFLVELEGLLAVEESVAVPPTLCTTLLALTPTGGAVAAGAGAAATTTSVSSWLTAAAAVVVLVGSGAVAVRALRSPAEEEGARSETVPPRVTANARAAPGPAPAAPFEAGDAERSLETPAAVLAQPGSATAMRASELLWTEIALPPGAPWDDSLVETGHLRGLIVDDDGRPLPRAEVVALSWVGAPKTFEWRAVQQTADDGSFDLRVAAVVAPPESQRYFVEVAHPDTLPLRVEAQVTAQATTDLGRVEVRRNVADRAGEWTLRVTLVGPDGEPVKGAGVRLYRKLVARAAAADPQESDLRPHQTFETGGVTDEFGTVQLSGKRVGDKLLEVYARFLGYRDSRRDFRIEAEGAREHHLVVERGLTLEGRLALPAGCRRAHLDAVPMAGGESYQGDVAADGAFVVRGLDPGAYRLRVDGDFSTAWVDDVAAGRSDVVVELKRRDDLRDVGVHRAELHGRIVAAKSGVPVRVDEEAIRLIAVPGDWRPDDPRVLGELVPTALRAQTSQTLVDDSCPPPPLSSDFHQTGLDAGSYLLLVQAQGYKPGVSRVVTVKEREIATDVVVSLE